MFSSTTDDWATPQAVYDMLNEEFQFNLDPCASPENAKCDLYYTKEQDGMIQDWSGHRVFCNPPYGRELPKWVKKAYESYLGGATVVMLIPARTDTSYFHDYIYHKAEIRFIRGRLKFGNARNSAPFPSMIVVYKQKKAMKYNNDYQQGWREAIEQACDWLVDNQQHPMIGCEDPCLSGYLTAGFMEDFKEAMANKLHTRMKWPLQK